MKWKWKARIQNILAMLPSGLSYRLYYLLQRNCGGLRRGASPISRLQAGIDVVQYIHKQNHAIVSKTFLEIGTGHQLNLPTALWLSGASKVITIDLNPYLKSELVLEDISYIRRNYREIAKLFGSLSERSLFAERMEKLIGWEGNASELFEMMHILYMAPADATALNLDSGSIDYHVSYAVLEHIPPQDLSQILREAKRVLRNDGLFVHCVDFSDHFSHSDGSISAVNFLQFSEKEWAEYAGNRYMYQNRLRIDDFTDLVGRVGLTILVVDAKIDPRSTEVLKAGFALDERFRSKSVEANATTSAWVVAAPSTAQD